MAEQIDGEQLLHRINRHVFLVLLHVSYPKLSYQIADAVVAVTDKNNEQKEIDEKFRSNPQWQLLPDEWSKKLGRLESRARGLVNGASVQFAARGMAVLPAARAGEIFAALRNCRAEMEQYRDQFVREYENILAQLKADLGDDLYTKAAKKLPRTEDIRRKFGIVWAIVPAGGSGADRAKLAQLRRIVHGFPANSKIGRSAKTRAEALINELLDENVEQITSEEADELITEAREQMHQFTREMLEDMAREPRQVLIDASSNLIEALSDQNRVIRNGTIDQVRRAFQMVEGFGFLASDELLERMRHVRDRLDGATPQELNGNEEAGAALATALRGVREAAADAQAASEVVRQFRGIRIRNAAQPQESQNGQENQESN